MNKYDYLESKFPESRYEDGDFDIDDLYDGVAYAYEDGFKDAINKACRWLQHEILEDYKGIVWDQIVEDFRKAMEE